MFLRFRAANRDLWFGRYHRFGESAPYSCQMVYQRWGEKRAAVRVLPPAIRFFLRALAERFCFPGSIGRAVLLNHSYRAVLLSSTYAGIAFRRSLYSDFAECDTLMQHVYSTRSCTSS